MPDLVYTLKVRDDGTAVIEKFSKTVQDVGKKTEGIGGAMSSAFSTVGNSISSAVSKVANLRTAIIGFIAGMGIKKVIEDYAALEERFDRLSALTDASTGSFERLKSSATVAAREFGVTGTEAVDAMNALAQAGFKADEIYATLPRTLELVRGAHVDLATAVDAVARAVKTLGVPVSEVGPAI